MNRRDIVIGIVILLGLGAAIYFFRKPQEETFTPPTPTTEEKIEDRFNVDIPDDAQKAELTDQTGGNGSAIATFEETNGTYIVTVLADISEPDAGQFYQAWLTGDMGNIRLGNLSERKGGWMLNYTTQSDITSYTEVMVTAETVLDQTPEEVVLRGSIN